MSHGLRPLDYLICLLFGHYKLHGTCLACGKGHR